MFFKSTSQIIPKFSLPIAAQSSTSIREVYDIHLENYCALIKKKKRQLYGKRFSQKRSVPKHIDLDIQET